MAKMELSLRAYFRIIKVARTIADLAGERDILPRHLIEAAGYRFLDRSNIGEFIINKFVLLILITYICYTDNITRNER